MAKDDENNQEEPEKLEEKEKKEINMRRSSKYHAVFEQNLEVKL